jgi:hypothetical protein
MPSRTLQNYRAIATALFAGVALAACHPRQEICENKDWNWTHRLEQTEPVVDVLNVTQAGTLLWNGRAISSQDLSSRLALRGEMNVTPTTLLRHERGVDCAKLLAIRNQIEKALDCASGKCSEGSEWDSIPDNGFDGFSGGQ